MFAQYCQIRPTRSAGYRFREKECLNIFNSCYTLPWLLKRPHINYNIHHSFKDNTAPEIYRNKFFEFCDHYKDFSRWYTDGSKMVNQVAGSFVSCVPQTVECSHYQYLPCHGPEQHKWHTDLFWMKKRQVVFVTKQVSVNFLRWNMYVLATRFCWQVLFIVVNKLFVYLVYRQFTVEVFSSARCSTVVAVHGCV